MEFKISEVIEISLQVEVNDGRLGFVSHSSDQDWASYALETDGGDLVAEHVSFEALEAYDEDLLLEWFEQVDPEGFALCDNEDEVISIRFAEEKLSEIFGSPDELYNYNRPAAEKEALNNWLESENPKVYRNDLRGFGNEFNLTFVLDDAEYTPGEGEYEVDLEEVPDMMFRYHNDPTTEDFSSIVVIE